MNVTYDLLQKGPSAWLPYIGISLLLTLVVYGAVPIAIATERKTRIRKRKYIWICFAWNLPIMIIVKLTPYSSISTSPYVLWTLLFVTIGVRILKKRDMLEIDTSYHDAFNELDTNSVEPKNSISTEETQNDSAESSEPQSELQVMMCRPTIMYCRKCGTKLEKGSHFCKKCGTAVIEE